MTTCVWYAAYGSNISSARFGHYIRGGRPEGASRTYAGCRDTREPTGWRPLQLPGPVFFGAASQVWGGGMAFYDPAASGRSRATAYRLTQEQFADVWSQECHRPVGETVPVVEVAERGEWAGGAGHYDRILLVGWIDAEPVLTFTFAGRRPEANPPAPAYAATIRRGLIETHGLTANEAAAHVAGLLDASRRQRGTFRPTRRVVGSRRAPAPGPR